LDNDQFLNVSRWFNAAEKTVTDLAKENNAPQNPQLVSTTNFNMGIVDDSVKAKILVGEEKPVFGSCNFQNNDETISDDDLQLNKLIGEQLKLVAVSGDQPIRFNPGNNINGIYILSGRYIVKGDDVTLKINVKQAASLLQHFEVNGKKDKLTVLAKEVVQEIVNWLKEKK